MTSRPQDVRMENAIEKSGIKDWTIKEMKSPSGTRYTVVDEKGIPQNYNDVNKLVTAMMERVAKTYEEVAPKAQTSPSTYRAKLPTPDYSNTRANFPADAYQSLSKPGKATAYTTDGKPDGIVYKGKDGKLYVPNKWDPEHPYEVNTGADGKPASVIMIYDEAGGDFAVGEPTTIASTYKNPATGELDPLYNVKVGKGNAMEIVKDQVPSAYKIVKSGTEIQTKEGPRVVQDSEIVVYDVDGDPYVMPKTNFLKRQEPLKGDTESEALYAKLKNGETIPESQIATDGNATTKSAKTRQASSTTVKTTDASFTQELSEIKGPDGKPFLTKNEINNLVKNCEIDGIPNYQAKIKAVLSNPKEVEEISNWKSKAAGVWKAIQDPLTSTKNANPELFGIKPKTQTAEVNTAKTTDASFTQELSNAKLELEQDLSSKSGMPKKDIATILENVNDDNISLAKQICTDELFIKFSENMKFVLKATNKENLTFAKKLCMEKKYPIDLIPHLIKNANKENMAFAEKLVEKENNAIGQFHRDDFYDIGKILKYTNKDNVAFAEKLFAEKRFTTSELANIQQHTSKYGLEFAEKCVKNKELSTKNISDILFSTNKDNLAFAKKLCADKEFPKNQIGQILEATNKDNLAFAERLCTDKEFPKDKIGYILLSTKKDNLILAEKLCADKVVPIDQAIDILRTTDYGLVSPEKINIGILKALSSKLYTMEGNTYIPGDKNYIKGVLSAMNKYPDFTNELADFKVDGKQFFSDMEVNDILYNCLSGKDNPAAKPDDIRKILNNPNDIEFMKSCKLRSFGLFKALFY